MSGEQHKRKKVPVKRGKKEGPHPREKRIRHNKFHVAWPYQRREKGKEGQGPAPSPKGRRVKNDLLSRIEREFMPKRGDIIE